MVDKNLRERLESGNTNISELHYKKDDIEFTSKLQNTFLYFGHVYCLAFVTSVTKRNEDAGCIQGSIFIVSDGNQGNADIR